MKFEIQKSHLKNTQLGKNPFLADAISVNVHKIIRSALYIIYIIYTHHISQ